MTKIQYRFNKIVILLIIAIGLYGVYLAYIDGVYVNKVFEYHNDISMLQTDKSEYAPGELVSVYVDFCKHENKESVTQWHLIDGIITSYNPRTRNIPIGCYKGWYPLEKIPEHVPNGNHMYHFEATSKTYINQLRTETRVFKTNNFIIK